MAGRGDQLVATARQKAAEHGDLDAAARLRARPQAEDSLWLVTEPALVADWEAAKSAVPLASFGGPEAKARAEVAVDEARRTLVASGAVQVVVRHAGRKKYRALLDEHLPTEVDHENIRAQTGNPKESAAYHSETFVPALIDLSMATEGVTAALLDELADEGRVSEAEITDLFRRAWSLYQGTRTADLGK